MIIEKVNKILLDNNSNLEKISNNFVEDNLTKFFMVIQNFFQKYLFVLPKKLNYYNELSKDGNEYAE